MPQSTLPQLTPEQRKENLAKAAVVRKERADYKAKIRNGEVSPIEALEAPVCQNMLVRQLLEQIPGMGKRKTAALMAEIGVKENRRVRGLGSKQRQALAEALGK